MSERASIFERPRIGVENTATPGTPVAANLVLRTMTVAPTPMIPRNAIRASGNMASVGMTTGKEHTEFSIDGPLSYTESAFLFASILGAPTSVTASGVTTLTYLPNAESANVLRTYTFECGAAGTGAAGWSGAFLTDLSISIDTNEAKVSGKGLGQVYQDPITLSASSTDVAIEPASSNQISVFAAATLVGLDSPDARLKRCLSANFSMAGRQSALFTLDDTQQSFSASAERFFDKSAQIVVEQDGQGATLMGALKNNAIIYVRYIAKGREISTGNPLLLQITFPCQIKNTGRQDTNDVYAGTYDLEPTFVTNAFGPGKSGYVEVVLKTIAATATQAATVGSAPAGNTGVRPVADITQYTALPATAQPVTP